jgi:hypothetical protein
MRTPFTGQRFISDEYRAAKRRAAEDMLDYYGRATVMDVTYLQYKDPVFAEAAYNEAIMGFRRAQKHLASLDEYDADWTYEYKTWVVEQSKTISIELEAVEE